MADFVPDATDANMDAHAAAAHAAAAPLVMLNTGAAAYVPAGYAAAAAPATALSSRPALTVVKHDHSAQSEEMVRKLNGLFLETQKANKDRLKITQSNRHSHLSSVSRFEELNLPPAIIHAIIHKMNYETPSAIQGAALPLMLRKWRAGVF